MPDPGKVVLQGVAYRKMPDAAAQPVRGAQIYFAPVNGSTTSSGRFLARTNACGHYMLMSCMVADITLQDRGKVIGVDPDFGVSATTFIPATPEATNAAGRKYFVMDDLVFRVQPENLADHTAPWADLELKGPDALAPGVVRANPQTQDTSATIVAKIKAYDTRDQRALTVSLEVDGVAAPPQFYGQAWSPLFSPIGVWPVKVVLSSGSHVLEALVKDKSQNLTRIHKDVVALDFPPEVPEDPNATLDYVLDVDGGLDSARSDGRIRVTFSRPVLGVDPTTLYLRKAQGARIGGVQLLSSQGVVSAAAFVSTVYLLPPSRLEEGTAYEVVGTTALRVRGGTSMPAKVLPFKVGRGQVLIPSQALPTSLGLQKIVALGGRMFATDGRQIHMMRMKDGTAVSSIASFGVTPGGDFLGQEVVGLGVFRQVSVLGGLVDLLLVTTVPPVGDLDHQAALWGFNACSSLADPELLFGVSLGPGGSGYASSIDCRDGIIVVPRISSSVLFIDAGLAWIQWDKDPAAVLSPRGSNAQAIVQPFYLADPEFVDPKTQSSPLPAHWSAVLVPQAQGVSALEAVVGFTQPTAQRRGSPLSGVPASWNPYTPGAYTPRPPFEADLLSQPFAGPSADKHAYPGPFQTSSQAAGQSAASRLALLPRVQARFGGQSRETNLVLAVSSLRPGLMNQGQSLPPAGNSLVILEASGKEEGPQQVGLWPKEPPFLQGGMAVPYEILRKVPSVDSLTGLAGVPVKNLQSGAITWFVLDPRTPDDVKVLSRQTGFGPNGALTNGILYAQVGANSVGVTQIAVGLAGVDEGECGFKKPVIEIAMDGERKGADKIAFTDANAKYLFWLNDDCDATSWKYDDLPKKTTPLLVDDDQQVGDDLVVGSVLNPQHVTAVPNCDDDVINGKRDLEDFTRLHLQVDGVTANLPGITYWLKFEHVSSGNPSANLFEAVDGTMAYLNDSSTADDQIKNKLAVTVGSSLVQLKSQFVKPGGQVSPFLLEGKSAGKGDLTLIVKWNGVELGRKAVQLELRPITEFYEKFVTITATGNDVATVAPRQNAAYTYVSISDEYLLYVHGWNMGEWEKDRWAETLFKRMWWLGYQGQVGIFEWPTLEGFTTYDRSDFRAWKSAVALKDRLTKLDAAHPGQVRVIAHSMGNVVTGEALHLCASQPSASPLVHTYIAAQAAIPAHCYDNSLSNYWVVRTPGLKDGYYTPNLYGHYFSSPPTPDSALSGQEPNSYLSGNSSATVHGIYRYYNKDDFALGSWDINNLLKPDAASGYFYVEGDGQIDTYDPLHGDVFYNGLTPLRFPVDQYEIFARCAQSRTRALGAIKATAPLQGFVLERDLQDWGYDDLHYSHSREFRSNLIDERRFWETVFSDFDFKSIK